MFVLPCILYTVYDILPQCLSTLQRLGGLILQLCFLAGAQNYKQLLNSKHKCLRNGLAWASLEGPHVTGKNTFHGHFQEESQSKGRMTDV